MKNLTNKKMLTCGVWLSLIAAWAVIPAVSKNAYVIHLLFSCAIFAILACSLNIVVGITGLPNMSHATFFGIGAYMAALLSIHFKVPFYVNLILGGLVSLLFGIALGLPTLRLKGFYLSLVTIGFGQIVRIVEINWVSLTRGPMGLPGIAGAKIGGYGFSKRDFIYYCMAVLAILIFTVRRMMNSKIGRALSAIKNDDIVAKSLGVNTTGYKAFAFSLSAFFAGMAGTIYAHYISFISPDSFTSADSTTILCMVILGGSGTLLGPVLGAIILTLAPEVLRFADMYRMVFVGVVMIVGVIAKECHLQDRLKLAFSSLIGKTKKEG